MFCVRLPKQILHAVVWALRVTGNQEENGDTQYECYDAIEKNLTEDVSR